jgi:hypothetical protein
VSSGGSYKGEQLTSVGRAFLAAVAKDRAAPFLAAHRNLINK